MAATEDWPIALCDAGPLIHLDEMDCLDLLKDFKAILIPEQVRDEVARHRPAALKSQTLDIQCLPVPISTDPQFRALGKAFSLDLGEQAALLLMGRYRRGRPAPGPDGSAGGRVIPPSGRVLPPSGQIVRPSGRISEENAARG